MEAQKTSHIQSNPEQKDLEISQFLTSNYITEPY
jgi:hypothetical protein